MRHSRMHTSWMRSVIVTMYVENAGEAEFLWKVFCHSSTSAANARIIVDYDKKVISKIDQRGVVSGRQNLRLSRSKGDGERIAELRC